MKTKTNMRMMTLDELKDKHIGAIGTPERDHYEFELSAQQRLELDKRAEDLLTNPGNIVEWPSLKKEIESKL